jgi:AcrR family transcriptional regulator
MGAEAGLRERKKQQTRSAIAAAALQLFAERGFDAASVAEVARAADVSVATVFNYFPTKEDLVYDRMEAFEEALLAVVRERGPGESVLSAFGRFIFARTEQAATDDVSERVATMARIVTASPALLGRELQVIARYTESLAALIAEEAGGGDDVEPRVAADALMAVHRALIDYARKSALAGRPSADLARDIRVQGERALALLERGLGDYGVKSRSPQAR